MGLIRKHGAKGSKGPILLGMSGGWTGLNWIELGGEAVEGPWATFFTACGPYGAHAIRQRNPLVGLGCS